MSDQKDKEAEINERIEKIRLKNEAIQRRYKEVEADKQNADVVSSSVATSPLSNAPSFSKTTIKPSPPDRKTFQHHHKQERESQPLNYKVKPRLLSNDKIYSSFKEGDGPPPDPRGFRSFLADDERDEPRPEQVKSANDKKIIDQARKQVISGGYTESNSKSRGRQKPLRTKNRTSGYSEESKTSPSEDKWRQERAAIDEARIQRQKTADGTWRRAWDNEKIPLDDVDDECHQKFGSKDLATSSRGHFQRSWSNREGGYGGNGYQDDAEPPRRRENHSRTMIFNRNRGGQHSVTEHQHTSHFESSPKYDEDLGCSHEVTTQPLTREVVMNGEQIKILMRPSSSSHQKPPRAMDWVRTSAPEKELARVEKEDWHSERLIGKNLPPANTSALKIQVPSSGKRIAVLHDDGMTNVKEEKKSVDPKDIVSGISEELVCDPQVGGPADEEEQWEDVSEGEEEEEQEEQQQEEN